MSELSPDAPQYARRIALGAAAARVAMGLALLLMSRGVSAHDPFDGSVQVKVFDDRLETTVTLGYDAARLYARSLGLPPRDAAALTRAPQGNKLVELPTSAAAILVRPTASGLPLNAVSLAAAPSDIELTLLVVTPTPKAKPIRIRASYLDLSSDMRPGTLVVVDGPTNRIRSSTIVSKQVPDTDIPPEAAPPTPAQAVSFFSLGLRHILGGFDHLLFIAATLLGVQGLRSLLWIVTAFTLSHSVTLGLVAVDFIHPPSQFVEPLIAASIVIACLANLFRIDTPRGRVWVTGLFGLVHGMGFASDLVHAGFVKSASGALLPLISFNMGIETGQLLVACLTLPLLGQLRRFPLVDRSLRTSLTGAIMVVGLAWLWRRTLG